MARGRGLCFFVTGLIVGASGCLDAKAPASSLLSPSEDSSAQPWSRFFLNITEPGPVAYLLKFRVEGAGPCVAARELAINKRGPGPFLLYQLAATTGTTPTGPSFQAAFGNGVEPSIHSADAAVDTRNGNYQPSRTEARGRTTLGTSTTEFQLVEVLVAWAPGIVPPGEKGSWFRIDVACGKAVYFEAGHSTQNLALFSLSMMGGGTGATTPAGSFALGDRATFTTQGDASIMRVSGYSGIGRVDVGTPKGTETIQSVNGFWNAAKADGPGRYSLNVREFAGYGAGLWAGVFDFQDAAPLEALPLERIPVTASP